MNNTNTNNSTLENCAVCGCDMDYNPIFTMCDRCDALADTIE